MSGRARGSAAVLGLVGAVLTLAGCDSGSGSAGGGPTVGTASLVPSAVASGTTAATTVPRPATTDPSHGPSATSGVGVSTAPAVRIGSGTTMNRDVLVTVSKVRPTHVKAQQVGDLAGPGVAVDLSVHNGSAAPFDLGGLVVNATYGRSTPAVPGGTGNGRPLAGKLRTGRTARGVYVFTVPAAEVGSVTVQVSSDASPVVLVFAR